MIAHPPSARLSWPNAFSLLVLLALVAVWHSSPADLDYLWQIRTGERILETGSVRQPDGFSYTIHGKPLPDHEWLYEVLLALVWRGFGDAGMKMTRVFLFAAPLAILAGQLSARGVRKHGIAVMVMAGIVVLFYFERLRPLVCSTIGLQLIAGWLHDHCHGRRRLDWKVPLTMLLWGNLHPAVIMGQALILGAIAWEWLTSWRNRSDLSVLRGLTVWGGLGLLASLVAPDPIGRLLYPFAAELRHPAQRLFIEIRPPWQFLGKAPHLMDFVLLLAVLFTAVLLVRRREFHGWEWALLVGVAGLAATATRATGDWLMVTAALAVPQIGPVLHRSASPRRRLGRMALRLDRLFKKVFQGPVLKPQPFWPAILFVALAIVSASLGSRLPNREAAHWPTEATEWIAQSGLPTPGPWNIFSSSDDGTYLLWRMPGRARVYTDTRGFYYPGDFLMDSYYLPDADSQWPQRLEQVVSSGTQYFLIRVDCKLWKLLESHSPAVLYRDAKFVILTAEQMREVASKVDASPACATESAQRP